ncbi:MAG TPA: hypothetical protein VMU16_04735 [Candidatus Binataceae bacterium]|nr:hypothetical protein [Candidatus Binataceae bacterium]
MPRTTVLVVTLGLILASAADARALSLTLSGEFGAVVRPEDAQAVYASDDEGVSTLITGVGLSMRSGGTVTEVGVPSMMPDGRVVFGAEIQPADPSLKPGWHIYIGNADAVPSHRVMPAINPGSNTPGCTPAFKSDPYPAADAEGNITFISAEPHGGDALFYYSNGRFRCLAKAGSKTNEGDEIDVLSFGSAQMGDVGEVVFNAFLAPGGNHPRGPHRQALLLASPTRGITELAVEGDYGPNHTRYEQPFGLPAVVSTPHGGTEVAFTAKTPSGAALFEYDGHEMARVLPIGTLTPIGPVSYLSLGRPGLMADGTTAVLAGCAGVPAIFRLSRQHLDLRIQRGQMTPVGGALDSLGDPVLTASGAMFVGATDRDGHGKIFVLSRDDALFELGSPALIYRIAFTPQPRHSIFTGTLTVNQRGDFAYLGGN